MSGPAPALPEPLTAGDLIWLWELAMCAPLLTDDDLDVLTRAAGVLDAIWPDPRGPRVLDVELWHAQWRHRRPPHPQARSVTVTHEALDGRS